MIRRNFLAGLSVLFGGLFTTKTSEASSIKMDLDGEKLLTDIRAKNLEIIKSTTMPMKLITMPNMIDYEGSMIEGRIINVKLYDNGPTIDFSRHISIVDVRLKEITTYYKGAKFIYHFSETGCTREIVLGDFE